MAILLKRSTVASVVPDPAELQVGELAVNSADGKLFTKKTDNTVTELTGGGASPSFLPAFPSAKPPTGFYVSAMLVSDTYSSLALVANRIYWIPFIPQRDLSVDAVAIGVVTAVAGGLVRCGIYADDGQGNPDGAPLVETIDFDAGTTGTKVDTTATVSLTAGTMYWFATIGSTTAAIRAVPRTALAHLFSDPATNVGIVGWYRNGWTYANPLPTLPTTIYPYNTTSPTPFLRIA